MCLALFLEPNVGRGNLPWAWSSEPWTLNPEPGALSPALSAGYAMNAKLECSSHSHLSELYLQRETMNNEGMSPLVLRAYLFTFSHKMVSPPDVMFLSCNEIWLSAQHPWWPLSHCPQIKNFCVAGGQELPHADAHACCPFPLSPQSCLCLLSIHKQAKLSATVVLNPRKDT